MPVSPKDPAAPTDRTPQAALSEGPAHELVGYQLAQAQIVTDRVFDEQMAEIGLRRLAFTVLALVQANPDVTARQLARALGVTPPNITVCLDQLQARALVARSRSELDGRLQHLRLTRAGTQLLRQAAQQLREGERTALAVLSDAERALLVELLHKVARARGRAA